jgi:hypothetical protein
LSFCRSTPISRHAFLRRTHAAQECDRLVRREIADRRAGIEEHRGQRREHAAKIELLREVGQHADAFDLRMVDRDARERRLQRAAGDVDRDVARHAQRLEPAARLAPVTGAEIDELRRGTDVVRDRTPMTLEDRLLGAGGVVLVERADRIEQRASDRVVEELRRNGGVSRQQRLTQCGELLRRIEMQPVDESHVGRGLSVHMPGIITKPRHRARTRA